MGICSTHNVSIAYNIASLKKLSLECQIKAVKNMKMYSNSCEKCSEALTILALAGIQTVGPV